MADHRDDVGTGGDSSTEPVIVLIGASAGGVQALQNFFGALPACTGAAFVVVVHLDPTHHSEMPSIIAARTKMPVVQIGERQRLEADHVYVIAPDRRLQIVDHEIESLHFDEPRGRRSPIDLLFRSLAQQLGDGFAVILSGAGSDGALGARAVKEAGGIVLVQDPNEAEYSSMPRSAIAAGAADFVLPARELAEWLAELIPLKISVTGSDAGQVDEESLRRGVGASACTHGSRFFQIQTRDRLAPHCAPHAGRQSRGLDGHTMRSCATVPEEAQALLSDLLICVTTFFRDGEAFQKLAQDVLPELFKDKAADETVRVWVPGCATGEEAYSFAILLLEEAARHKTRRQPIQVFGSDLDARALASAREGRFPLSIEADVSEERLRRFFVRDGDHYRVRAGGARSGAVRRA